MATVVSQVGKGHDYTDYGERCHGTKAPSPRGCARIPDPCRDTDHVIGEPELPQQPSQTSEHEPNVAQDPVST